MVASSAMRGEAMAIVARIAYKLDRPYDMFVAVNMMAEEHFELNVEQRKLLITAYRIIFSAKRRALRIISVMEQQEDNSNHIEYIAFYREVLEDDMQATCMSTLDIVENHLLPFCRDAENATLYNKMIGDTCWFLAMLKKVEDKEPFVEKALVAYKTASKKAEILSPADPMRLSVDLTKTAFYHDIMNRPERAYALAKQALDKARPVLVLLNEESYKESTEYVRLMEENLKMWCTTMGKDPEDILSFKELQASSSSSTGYPCPVVPPSVLALAPDTFTSPGDWGHDVHEGLSASEIRHRKKAAQMKKGRMG
ncbi:unnamed protein product [Urochloa decumbens]|uniref:14-3-3 domain-containing protein n=1 Tax=Urochloa decumbens TaxID=240449 RepID=A0ABC8W6R2_9POAL